MTTIQPVMFWVMLYLMPSVLLMALLLCREHLDSNPEELKPHRLVARRES